jgi:hypothetical protein
MKRKMWLALFVVPVLAFGLIGDVAAGDSNDNSERELTAHFKGANEVPPIPGSDLMGTAQVTINLATSELCWELEYTTSLQVTAAHIHRGVAGMNGPVVFGFFNPPPSTVPVNEGCRSGNPALLADIAAHPGNYYVNLHTTAHPGGEARGQLTSEEESD